MKTIVVTEGWFTGTDKFDSELRLLLQQPVLALTSLLFLSLRSGDAITGY